jgi:hypothetical protein
VSGLFARGNDEGRFRRERANVGGRGVWGKSSWVTNYSLGPETLVRVQVAYGQKFLTTYIEALENP